MSGGGQKWRAKASGDLWAIKMSNFLLNGDGVSRGVTTPIDFDLSLQRDTAVPRKQREPSSQSTGKKYPSLSFSCPLTPAAASHWLIPTRKSQGTGALVYRAPSWPPGEQSRVEKHKEAIWGTHGESPAPAHGNHIQVGFSEVLSPPSEFLALNEHC